MLSGKEQRKADNVQVGTDKVPSTSTDDRPSAEPQKLKPLPLFPIVNGKALKPSSRAMHAGSWSTSWDGRATAEPPRIQSGKASSSVLLAPPSASPGSAPALETAASPVVPRLRSSAPPEIQEEAQSNLAPRIVVAGFAAPALIVDDALLEDTPEPRVRRDPVKLLHATPWELQMTSSGRDVDDEMSDYETAVPDNMRALTDSAPAGTRDTSHHDDNIIASQFARLRFKSPSAATLPRPKTIAVADTGASPTEVRSLLQQRKQSLPQVSILTGHIDRSAYDRLGNSPAISFLASLAENTAPPSRPVSVHSKWDDIQVGQYLIGKRLGEGSHAVVHEAHIVVGGVCDANSSTPSIVAIKILQKRKATTHQMTALNFPRSTLSLPRPRDSSTSNIDDSDEGWERERQFQIQQEITIWRRLHHPNIVQLYEVIDGDTADGPDSNFVFLVAEYCKNGHLLNGINQHRAKGGLREPIARYLFRQVVEAVHYLHVDIGVVHRDIKPENIMLSTDDAGHLVAKLADFGLAHPYRTDATSATLSTMAPRHRSRTSGGGPNDKEVTLPYTPTACAGSLAYCAPEKIMAQPMKVYHPQPAADMWALGVVLYAMVTAQLPFSDEYTPRLQLKIMRGTYPPLRTKYEVDQSQTCASWFDGDGTSPQRQDDDASTTRIYSEELVDIIRQLLLLDVGSRLTADGARKHAWLLSVGNGDGIEESA